MAATASRHYSSYAAGPHKTLPITMPSKAPLYHQSSSRIAMSPPEMSDYSTTSGSRSSGRSYSARSSECATSQPSDYESVHSQSGVDVVDMLSDRMNRAFDPIKMDKSLVRQAQTSGQLNAKQRELAELQALAQRRLKGARANFSEGMDAARETRRDLDYSQKKISSMKSKTERAHPEAYAQASSRHSRREH